MRITFNTDHMLKATFHVPYWDDFVSVPVIGWDEFGRAVVSTPSGQVEPAMKIPGFIEIETQNEGTFSGRYYDWMPESDWAKKRREEKRSGAMAEMDPKHHNV